MEGVWGEYLPSTLLILAHQLVLGVWYLLAQLDGMTLCYVSGGSLSA